MCQNARKNREKARLKAVANACTSQGRGGISQPFLHELPCALVCACVTSLHFTFVDGFPLPGSRRTRQGLSGLQLPGGHRAGWQWRGRCLPHPGPSCPVTIYPGSGTSSRWPGSAFLKPEIFRRWCLFFFFFFVFFPSSLLENFCPQLG